MGGMRRISGGMGGGGGAGMAGMAGLGLGAQEADGEDAVPLEGSVVLDSSFVGGGAVRGRQAAQDASVIVVVAGEVGAAMAEDMVAVGAAVAGDALVVEMGMVMADLSATGSTAFGSGLEVGRPGVPVADVCARTHGFDFGPWHV